MKLLTWCPLHQSRQNLESRRSKQSLCFVFVMLHTPMEGKNFHWSTWPDLLLVPLVKPSYQTFACSIIPKFMDPFNALVLESHSKFEKYSWLMSLFGNHITFRNSLSTFSHSSKGTSFGPIFAGNWPLISTHFSLLGMLHSIFPGSNLKWTLINPTTWYNGRKATSWANAHGCAWMH